MGWLDRLPGRKKAEPQRSGPPQKETKAAAAAQKHEPERLSREEQEARWRERLLRWMRFSVGQLPAQVPAAGREGGYAFRFPLAGTLNEVTVTVRPDGQDETLRQLTVQAARRGYDLCAMHYVRTGTTAEMVAYFADEANAEELLASIRELSACVDSKF